MEVSTDTAEGAEVLLAVFLDEILKLKYFIFMV